MQAFKNDKKYGPEVHQKIEIHKALNKIINIDIPTVNITQQMEKIH